MRALAIVLLALSTQAAFAEPGAYNAQDSLRRAQVGTYSPRLAPPVKVEPVRKGAPKGLPQTFDRLECKVDSFNQLICKPRRTQP